jgi:hypothetical protein
MEGPLGGGPVTLPVIARLEADFDVIKARRWYDRQWKGLGNRFRDKVLVALERIESNPFLYAPIWTDVRVAPVPKFPYHIYYRVLDTRVDVFGVFHAKRHRRVWQKRM